MIKLTALKSVKTKDIEVENSKPPIFIFETHIHYLREKLGEPTNLFRLRLGHKGYHIFTQPRDEFEPSINVTEFFDVHSVALLCHTFINVRQDETNNVIKSVINTQINDNEIILKHGKVGENPSFMFTINPPIFIRDGYGGTVADRFVIRYILGGYKVFSSPEGFVLDKDVTEHFNIKNTLELCAANTSFKEMVDGLSFEDTDKK